MTMSDQTDPDDPRRKRLDEVIGEFLSPLTPAKTRSLANGCPFFPSSAPSWPSSSPTASV